MIGLKIRDFEIMDSDNVEDFVRENNVDIAIVCIPKNGAQLVADKLVRAGIKGIWNFAPIDLEVPSNIIVENVNLTESLFTLSYLMKENVEDQAIIGFYKQIIQIQDGSTTFVLYFFVIFKLMITSGLIDNENK